MKMNIPARLIRELQTDGDYEGDGSLRAHYDALSDQERHAVNWMFQRVCVWSLATLFDWDNRDNAGYRPGEADWNRQHYDRVAHTP
jgi:hypothetical protein